MKYYKGTRRRNRSSKSKAVSPGSQNTTSTTKDVNEVLVETNNSQSSSTKKEKTNGKKRPSSTSPLTEEQSTGRAKRAKTRHTTSKEELRNNNKSEKSNTVSDSAVENEPETSSKPKKRSQNGAASTRSRSKGSASVVTSPPRASSRRKRMKSNEVSQTHSDSSLSNSSKTRETPRKTVYGKVKLSNPRKPDQNKSKSSNSSETPDSAFEDNDDEEMQPVVKRKESESSLEVASGDVTSEELISYSEFLQQQVQILKTSFEIEDCPELAEHLQGTKRQQKNHIPREIVLKVLRKLNYKVEDDLLKTLNRQAQRKILKQIDEIRTAHGMMGKKRSKEEDSKQEPETNVEDLKKTLEASTIELDGLKKLADMAAKIESMADDFSKNPLVEEVKRTNELIQKINQKVKKEGFANLLEKTATTNDPLGHKEIVNNLFS